MPPDDPASVVPVIDGQPKRVILRLRYKEFDGDDDESPKEAIATYLNAAGRKMEECKNPHGRHNWHVQPRSDDVEETVPNASFHVVLDLEKDSVEGGGKPDMDKMPHEIYRLRRRDDGKLAISRLPDRYLTLAREITDGWFKWGDPLIFVGREE